MLGLADAICILIATWAAVKIIRALKESLINPEGPTDRGLFLLPKKKGEFNMASHIYHISIPEEVECRIKVQVPFRESSLSA